MISARFDIRSDRAIFNTGGFSGSIFTEAIDRAFIANAIAKVPRMRIGLPKNFKPGASYRRADIVTKYVGTTNRRTPTTAETSFEERGKALMTITPSGHILLD